MRSIQLKAAVVAVGFVLAACGPGNGEDVTTPSATVVTELVVTSDIPYFAAADEHVSHLDVYRPEESTGLPLVVLFHPNPAFGRTKRSERSLARGIAERGAVVVVPTYGTNQFDPAKIVELAREQGPCAVWVAVDHGLGLGAAVDELFIVGDVTGAIPGERVVFAQPDRVDGCRAHPRPVTVEELIVFEGGDWMLIPDLWDPLFTANRDYFSSITNWDDVGEPTPTRLHYLVGELTQGNTRRSLGGSDYLDTEWIKLRDPTGERAGAWEGTGALDDGDMTFTEVTEVVVEHLVAAGWDADLAVVPGVGHSLSTAESKQVIIDLIFDD